MKICKDCKHSGDNHPELKYKSYTSGCVPCMRLPDIEKIDVVRGNNQMVPQLYCSIERYDGAFSDKEKCGSEARFFEPLVV